jgi:plasmid replication initiation protein
MTSRPLLVVNPRSDADFNDLAHRLAANGAHTPAALERELRDRYPKAVVRERSLSSESITTWYVYREGAWVRAT